MKWPLLELVVLIITYLYDCYVPAAGGTDGTFRKMAELRTLILNWNILKPHKDNIETKMLCIFYGNEKKT